MTKEPLAHRHCTDLDARQAVPAHRGLTLQTRPEVIRAHTNLQWWPQTA